jgi:2-polyprenyl-3-methyl-5-hydroxy-6-metoxy-1,4-benzoquinol methylase
MHHTLCALCESDGWDQQLYPEKLPPGSFTGERFSARRMPDRVHYRMVRCGNCGSLRSDPVLSDDELAGLYSASRVTYGEEAAYAGDTYAAYLRDCLALTSARGRLLEIGCGTGFFLERALDLGFSEVHGVEPSRDAIEQASARVRAHIRDDCFREGLYPENFFDIICGFQVFDHLTHPNEVLQACRRALRPRGLVFWIHHDLGAWTHRLLGEASPIIDVEHVYLFDQKTMGRMLAKNGFKVLRVFRVRNRYPLHYWTSLAPLPSAFKRGLLPILRHTALGRIALSWNAGNFGIVGVRDSQ